MRAVRIHEYGDTGVLRVEEVPRPAPGPGEVLVKVAATAFNAVDILLRTGAVAERIPMSLPYTPGIELSGTVAELGADVTTWSAGDRVMAFVPLPVGGGAAEFAVVAADLLGPAPAGVPLADAAAIPTAGLSARQILFELGGLTAGARVLINGAGGAVGGLAVQLAKQAGATVLATASSRSAATIRSYGADEVIDYTVTAVAEAVTEPVDLLVNLVAGPPPEISRLTALVKPGGRAISAPPLPLTDDEDRDVRWIPFFARGDAAQLADLAAAVDRGDLRLDVSARYPFTDIAEVQADGEAGRFRGKVILTVEE